MEIIISSFFFAGLLLVGHLSVLVHKRFSGLLGINRAG
jgi:hypothetical protein